VTAAPLVLADWFGVGDLGLLVGGFYTGLGFGAFVGPTISGLVIDQAGYRPAVALVLVTTVLSCGALMLRLEDGA
jgi:MFS family permease